jgi:Phage P22-like portal protein
MADRSPADVKEFLDQAFERFKASELAEAEWRRDGLDDVKFYFGDQWQDTARRRRKKNKQPILTINRLPQFKQNVTNEIHANRPAIKYSPRRDATVGEAEMLQGHARNIELDSCAEMVYDVGTDQMVISGLGFWRVCTEYMPGITFEQRITIKPIRNQFMCYDDPDAEELDRSDRKYFFIVVDMDKDQFKKEYPNSQTTAALQQFQSIGDNAKAWLKEGGVRVAEYYTLEDEEEKIYELKNGRIVTEEPADVTEVERERTVCHPKVCWHKISALDILEEQSIPCDFIPVVVVKGEESNLNGRMNWQGLVRNAKDAQRAYNYWKTSATAQIALASKDPYVAASGQIQNHEEEWRNAHLEDPAVLTYEPMVEANQLLPPPARDHAEPPIQAMSAMMAGASNDLMATTGLNDASLGERRPDEAAKSVLLRQQQGGLQTSHYSDSVANAVRFTGELVLSFLKNMDESPRQARIVKPDDSVEHVVLHKGDQAGADKIKTSRNQRTLDLSKGEFDVAVEVGPSFHTKRQEAVNSIMSLIKAVPTSLQIVGDLLVGNMDWHLAPEIAKRFRKMLPPQLQDEPTSGNPEQELEQVKTQLQVLSAQHQKLAQIAQQQAQIINTKQIEANSRERVASINAAAGVLEAEVKGRVQANLDTLNAELDALQARFQMLHATPPEQPPAGAAPPAAGGTQ